MKKRSAGQPSTTPYEQLRKLRRRALAPHTSVRREKKFIRLMREIALGGRATKAAWRKKK